MSTLLKRLLPAPLLSLILLVTWLLMVRSLAPGQLLLGSLLALLIPPLTQHFRVPTLKVRQPLRLIGFVLKVLRDIVVANLEVTRLIWTPNKAPHPGFVEYPLTVKDPLVITVLANTITMTPGTVSTNIRLDRSSLLIHALDMEDEQALIRDIQERYERPLMEIFGC